MIDKPPLFARFVIIIVALFVTSFFTWAAIAKVEEIARGEGKVIPLSKTQIIQTSEPGVVEEIAVKVGEVVEKGQLLLRLNNMTTASTLGEATAKRRTLMAKIARLDIEANGNYVAVYQCPPEVAGPAPDICANEQRLLEARRQNYRTKLSVLNQRMIQRQAELNEVRVKLEGLENNLAVSGKKHELLEKLNKKHLVAEIEFLTSKEKLTEMTGQIDSMRRSVPGLEAAVTEAEAQIKEISSEVGQEALGEKTQALADLSVVEETIRGVSDRVARTDIRSPVDGIVNTLEVNTLGAFVQPGAVVAEIVPTSDKLLVEARISPRDVAFVRRGQNALVKITAFDFSIFGGLEGEVTNVSADSLVDKESGNTYYQVYVRTGTSLLEKDGKEYSIMPGMVTTVEIMTGRKTVLSYLMKPINKARTEALTER
jgi:adhesin transport system membrane fusion protein